MMFRTSYRKGDSCAPSPRDLHSPYMRRDTAPRSSGWRRRSPELRYTTRLHRLEHVKLPRRVSRKTISAVSAIGSCEEKAIMPFEFGILHEFPRCAGQTEAEARSNPL